MSIYLLFAAKIGDSDRLRPEELNQQNIEALVAENNLVSIVFFVLSNVFVFTPCLVFLVDLNLYKDMIE